MIWCSKVRVFRVPPDSPPLNRGLNRGVLRFVLVIQYRGVIVFAQCQSSPISMHPNPNFFSGRKAIARRSSSAARPMRTAAARRGPPDPQLTSCKREATEQTV